MNRHDVQCLITFDAVVTKTSQCSAKWNRLGKCGWHCVSKCIPLSKCHFYSCRSLRIDYTLSSCQGLNKPRSFTFSLICLDPISAAMLESIHLFTAIELLLKLFFFAKNSIEHVPTILCNNDNKSRLLIRTKACN